MIRKIDLTAIVGSPGTGKSTMLINQAIQKMQHQESIYIMTPTNAAKKRIVSGFLSEAEQGNINKWEYKRLCSFTHTLQFNYNNEQHILIDEFSMLNIENWYSLLFKLQNKMSQNGLYYNIYAYGDIKQLPPVRNNGTLGVLLKVNINKISKQPNTDFGEYVANKLYKDIKEIDLIAPRDWNDAFSAVRLIALHKNYRLSGHLVDEYGEPIDDYDERFYNYVYENNLISANNELEYCKWVETFINKEYLIVTPTHKIGGIIDNYMADKLSKEELEKTAPFLRNGSNIYWNPKCEVDYGFDFVDDLPENNDDIEKKYKYSFYSTVHSCQGATVDSVVFVTMNCMINSHVKDFYSNNMLYTALSRARNNSYFLGDGSIFQVMRTNYNEVTTKPYNYMLQREAADIIYKELKGVLKEEKLTYQKILARYKDKFNEVVSKEFKIVQTAIQIDKKYKPEPFSDNTVMSMLNRASNNQKVKGHLDDDWYNEQYRLWFVNVKIKRSSKAGKLGGKSGGKIGGKIGGKHSSVKEWLNNLSDDELNKVNDDMYLSMRKFKAKYHHDKRSVEKLLK